MAIAEREPALAWPRAATEDLAYEYAGEPESRVEALSQEALEARIDQYDAFAQQRGREAVLAKVEIGRCLAVQKLRQPKGFVGWAKDRWGYSQQYGTVLMFLAQNHARVRALLDQDPSMPLRAIASDLKGKLKEAEQPGAGTERVFPVATPDDVLLEVLDAGRPLPPHVYDFVSRKSHGRGIDLVWTSWPYCLGESRHGYIDFADYGVWLEAAASWAERLCAVLAPNGRAVINLPFDVRKDQPWPRPIAFDGLQLLQSARLRYAGAIVWAKAENGHTTNTVARGSVNGRRPSPNAPTLATGDELLLVVHKGEWNLGRPGEPTDLVKDAMLWQNAHWIIQGEADRRYPHVAPLEVVERSIQLLSYPGDLVADFHCGRGTTAVAAVKLGRSFVGGDINPTAVAIASQDVAAAHTALERRG